jgi:hypothetical protein
MAAKEGRRKPDPRGDEDGEKRYQIRRALAGVCNVCME